ncbi:MAG: hypothetical protein RLZZ283_367 [Candidatus Parcubacteria bacterium]|jgi:endonuclease/exonuclease/phosphatase family metal-dependent hydrolase
MKLLQWNIWYKENIKNVLELIREINPDIITLQELTINSWRQAIVNQNCNETHDTAKYIADELGFNYYFKEGQAEKVDGVEQILGNAIFSRYPIVKQNFSYIQEPLDTSLPILDYSLEGRVYLEVTLDVEGKELTVGTTHMSYTHRFLPTPAKDAETNKLLEILKEKKSNYIFAADFNSLPDSRVITETQRILKNAGPALTENTWTTKPFSYNGFDANTLDWRLDYCFATPDVLVTSAKVIETDYSDHLPILIEI